MSTIEKRGVVFGFLAGFWILILGIYIYIDGIQYRSGVTLSESLGTCTLTYNYTTLILPQNTVGMIIGFPLILLGMYICWLSATKERASEGVNH